MSSPSKKLEAKVPKALPSKPKAMIPPREVQLVPNPDLVIINPLSTSYLKLLEVANALKLQRAS
jgi:hypothetical protein